jgi:beta-galactosidase
LNWPDIGSHFGQIDYAGFPKDTFWWYAAWWNAEAAAEAADAGDAGDVIDTVGAGDSDAAAAVRELSRPEAQSLSHLRLDHWRSGSTDGTDSTSATTPHTAEMVPSPVLHFFPHWNWTPGELVDLWVYSTAPEVEMSINNVSLGRKLMPLYGHVEYSQVPFAAGEVRTAAYKRAGDASAAVLAVRRTAGAASGMRMLVRGGREETSAAARGMAAGGGMMASSEGLPRTKGSEAVRVLTDLQADGVDVVMVEVWIVDQHGVVVPTAGNMVVVTVTGPGAVAGGGNGDPADHTLTNSSMRPAFNGALMVAVRGAAGDPGTIHIEATSTGLEAASVVVESREPLWW